MDETLKGCGSELQMTLQVSSYSPIEMKRSKSWLEIRNVPVYIQKA